MNNAYTCTHTGRLLLTSLGMFVSVGQVCCNSVTNHFGFMYIYACITYIYIIIHIHDYYIKLVVIITIIVIIKH